MNAGGDNTCPEENFVGVKDDVLAILLRILDLLAPNKTGARPAMIRSGQNGCLDSRFVETGSAKAGDVHLTQHAAHWTKVCRHHGILLVQRLFLRCRFKFLSPGRFRTSGPVAFVRFHGKRQLFVNTPSRRDVGLGQIEKFFCMFW